MDLQRITDIVNSTSSSEEKEYLIIETLSRDKNIIPTILEMISIERKNKSELISEMNLQLSRADLFINNPRMADKEFITGEISRFYSENKDVIFHCFKKKKDE